MTTVAAHPNVTGRWVEYAAKGVEDWEVIYADGEDDYQGECEFIARSPDGKQYVQVEWGWGSCSGCDGYEDLSEEEVTTEFETRNREFFDFGSLRGQLELLEAADYQEPDRIAAIAAEVDRVEMEMAIDALIDAAGSYETPYTDGSPREDWVAAWEQKKELSR